MLRLTGVALWLLVCTSPVRAHDPFVLDARRATPGPKLELVELPSGPGAKGKQYRLRVGPGVPRGVVFGVFTKPFDHAFHEVASGLQLDASGHLVAGDPTNPGGRQLEDMVFGPGPYPLGAVWEIALVSADRAVRVFARVVPYSITASDGPCRVSLELSSYLGDQFSAFGTGFPPGEQVVTELQYSGRQFQKQRMTSAEGLLAPELLSHRPVGADRGARYVVRASRCRVSIDYDWGEPALTRR